MYLKTQIQNLIAVSKKSAEIEPYYEVLEYIETDGTQYYKTGEILSSTSKVECRASVLGAATPTGSAYIFGAYGAGRNFGINKASSTGCFCVWGSNSTVFTPALNLDTFYDISLSSDGLYVDGTKVLTPSGTFTGVSEAYISWANGTSQPVAKIKLTCLKIYQSGTLAKDYIPVLDSQLRPCLYDKVSKTFLYHTNSEGSTSPSFKRWNKFEVDYIQSSGTQYIDTGYAFADDFSYEIEYKGLNNGECLLGGRTSSVRTAILYRAMATQVDGQTTVPIAGLNATQTPFKLGVLSDTKHKVKVAIANNKGNVWVDDTQIYTDQSFTGTYISGKTTAIFADHFGDQTGTSEYQEFATSGLYALKFWQGTTPVRDYKPVVWHNGDTTAVACMYDEVYNKMYTNAGTGSFKAYITNISTTKTNVFTTTGATSGKAINAEGTIINSSASSYSDLLPIVGGTVIECVSGDTGNNNYRYHCYDSSGNWIEQSLVLYPEGAGTVSPITGSFTAPANAKYVRVSYATQASSTIQVKSAVETIYEVGSNCFVTPTTASQQVTNNYFNTGLYGNDDWNVKLIAFTSTNVAGQLFGNFISSSATNNLTINSGTATGTGTISRFDSQAMTQDKIINMGINQKSLLQINKIGAWQDSTQVVAWNNPNSFTTSGTCYLCGTNGSATVRPNGCCYLAIDEDGTLVAEYIPVRNATVTTETGLYDRVSGTLNKGVGTHTFNSLS